MLVDSHCHLNLLDLADYAGDLTALLQDAEQAGLGHVLCVGVDLTHAKDVIAIAERYPGVSASVGCHPSEKMTEEPTITDLLTLALHPKVVAIGETGLDYYYNDSGLDNMRERFRLHVRAALETNKPLIIHSRSAPKDTIDILRSEGAEKVKGVMHCFTESLAMAEEALALGFYISFSGIVTFKKAQNVVEVAKAIPLERLLIETDAPYLTPVPYRGKPNRPQYVQYVAEFIADLKQVTTAEVIAKTSTNFFDLFKFAQPTKTLLNN